MSRRILLASYHFPPSTAVGGLRIAKFARTLSEFGWEPYVLTVRDDLRENGLDTARLDGLENVPILRTAELPRLLEALASIKSALKAGPISSSVAAAKHSCSPTDQETARQRLKRYAASLLWHLPDQNKNWALYACASAVRLIRQHEIDWVLTSGPPFSGHVIGLVARTLTTARWVADFRDPWIDMLDDRDLKIRSSVSDRIERQMEAMVARRADRVLTTTWRMRDAMRGRYPGIAADRFAVIPNSIDADKFPSRPDAVSPSTLTITYAGSLYFDRTPEPLFRALRILIESGRAVKNDFRVRLVGDCQNTDGVDTREIVARYGLEGAVEIIPSVPYLEAVRMMQQSQLLLVLAPQRHRLVIPAKMYDYLGSGSTILGIAEPGATADLIAETQCGTCFSESNAGGLADYLATVLRTYRVKQFRNDPAAFSQYHVRHLTQQFVAEMNQVDIGRYSEVLARS